MKSGRTIILLCFVFLWNADGFCHGLKYALIQGGVGVEVTYDDGTPMQFSEVAVFSPAQTKNAFQQGFSDKHGRFVFFPDEPGLWRVTVDDGMGHLLRQEIDVDKAFKLRHEETSRWARFRDLIFGVSVIFGIFGIASLVLSRMRPGR